MIYLDGDEDATRNRTGRRHVVDDDLTSFSAPDDVHQTTSDDVVRFVQRNVEINFVSLAVHSCQSSRTDILVVVSFNTSLGLELRCNKDILVVVSSRTVILIVIVGARRS